jgi:uncharacterized membrane protein YbhN (UPF0104 family)
MTRAMTREHLGTSLRVLAGLLVSALCLWLAFREVPLEELGDALARANYWWLVPAALLQLAAVLARARRWQVLLLGQASFGEVFWALAVGLLATNIFPLRAGEAARVLVLNRRTGIPFVQVSASVVLERALDLIVVLGLLVGLLPFMHNRVPAPILLGGLGLGAALVGALAAIVLLVVAEAQAQTLVARLAQHLPGRLGRLLVVGTQQVIAGLEVLRQPGAAARAVAWSLFIWVATVAIYWAVIEAVVPGASFVEPAFAIAAISIGISLPSSPGFVGVFQLVGQQALVAPFPERYSLSSALSIALLAHVTAYSVTTAVGVLGLVRLGLSLGAVRSAEQAAHPARPL